MSATNSGGNDSETFARFLVRGKAPNGRENVIKAYGTRFPSGHVRLEYRTDAWPEAERLDGAHRSDFASMDDFKKTRRGDVIEWIDAEETKYGGQL
jgi:hypothetical protein